MHAIRRISATLLAVLTTACASPPNAVLFVSTTSIGIDAESRPTSFQLGYHRNENLVLPTQGEDAPAVQASMISNGAVFNRDVVHLLASGPAAASIANLQAHSSESDPGHQMQTTPLTPNPAPGGNHEDRSAEKRILFFGSSTTVGLKLSVSKMAGDNFVLGIKRKEISLIPASKTPGETPSVIAHSTSDTTSESNEGSRHFFATGSAAEAIASDPFVHYQFQIAADTARAEGVTDLTIDRHSAQFSGAVHRALLKKLVANSFAFELQKALHFQDIVHQFESKAHFDNCDFENSIRYIESLLEQVGIYSELSLMGRKAGNTAKVNAAAKRAFFVLGQALHSVQDFYAHTDYVDKAAQRFRTLGDIPIIMPWTQEGKSFINEQAASGELKSGFVFWGLPQKCPAGSKSHADLAKDKPDSPNGQVPIPTMQNRTLHEIATYLAGVASQRLIEFAFKRWPLLKELNEGQAQIDAVFPSKH